MNSRTAGAWLAAALLACAPLEAVAQECAADPGPVGAVANAVDEASHASHHSWWSSALHVADDVATVGGIAVGVAALAGVGAPILPIAGVAIGGYFAARAIGDLVDRGLHHQSLNPIASAAARDDYLMAASGALGAGAIASGARLLGIGAAAAGTATLPDGVIGLAHGWGRLGNLQRGLAVAQIGVAAATLGRSRVAGDPAATPEEAALRARAIESGALSRSIAADALSAPGGLDGALSRLMQSPTIAQARISLTVADGEGRTLYASDPQLALNPASNSKLATAAFALDRLGPDHRFETPFRVDAAGNLHVEGGFDPSIDDAALADAARAIRAAGVKRVGDVVLDDSRLAGARAPSHYDEFGDADWEYLAPPAALASNKGLLNIRVRPGEPPTITTDSGAVAIDASGVRTVGPGEQFRIGADEEDVGGRLVRDASGKPIVRVWGTIASDYPVKTIVMKSPVPVDDFGSRLRAALGGAGVRVDGGVREGTAPADARTVYVRRSPPLGELLASSLAKSNAFDHEVYAAAASAETHGGRASVAGSEADLNGWLAGTLGHPVRFDNASGLGDANRLSSADVVKLLSIARRDPRLATMPDSLARPGLEGTLRLRMVGSAAEGRLRAKTGTMARSIALSGVADSPSGTRVFSALVDGAAGSREDSRAFVDALGIVLSSK